MNKTKQNFNLLSPNWLRAMCFVLLAMVSYNSNAQQVVIGATTGTTNSYFYGPIYRSSAASTFNWSNYAYLYTSTELGIPGGSLITNIDWLKYSAGTLTGSNNTVEVWLENTSATALTSGTTWGTLKSTATLVYSSSTENITGAAGTYWGVTPSTFIYTGGNLKVLVRHVKAGTASAAVPFYTNTATNLAIGIAAGAATTDASALSTASYGNNRPTVRFTYTGASPCAGVPNPGNTIASAASVCPGATFGLSLQNSTSGTGVSYQWESADDAAFSVNVASLGTSPSQSTSQTSTKWYRCTVTCSTGPDVATSTPVEVTMNSFYGCYCASAATSTADEDISNVTFGSLNNSSTCSTLAPGTGSVVSMYSNYKDGVGAPTAPIVQQGEFVPFSLTQTSCGGAYGNSFDVYIDYNQNGSFADAGELVYDGASFTGNHTDVGTIEIPYTSTLGVTAMRVINVEGGATSPCQSYSWGETEDYLINITPNTACSGTPNPGNTVSSASAVCAGTSFTLSLQNPTLGSGVTYVWESADDAAFTTNVTTLSSTTPSQVIASQSLAKYYHCIVTCASGPSTATSTEVYVAQNPGSACYCTPVYSSGIQFGDLISNVVISGTTLANNTGTATTPNVPYTYFPASLGASYTANLTAGNTYNVVVTIGSFSNQGLKAWIDYNDDGFFDASEVIGNTTVAIQTAFGTGTFPITVACNPPTGVHRMRIREVYANAGPSIDPCISYGYGETEDYDVTIDPALPCPAPSNFTATPNAGGATLTWTPGCVETDWDVHVTTVGGGIPTGTATNPGVTSTTLALTTLDPNTQYEAWLEADCDPSTGGGQSTWVGPIVFTTGANCFPPTSLVVSNVTSSDAEVNFTAPAGGAPAGYEYYVSTSATAPTNATAGTTITGPGATQTTLGNALTPNTLHYVWVRSTCGLMPVSGNPNNSAWSASTTFTTLNVPCSGTPTPGNISPSSACAGSTVTLSLQNPTIGTGVTYQWFDGGANPIAGATNATYTTPAIVGGEQYYCEVTCASGPATGTSNTVTITLNPFSQCYCSSAATTTADEEIYGVSMTSTTATASQLSTCATTGGAGSVLNQYSNYTANTPLDAEQGSVVNFTLDLNACGTGTYNNGTAIWIDFDHNGIFDEPSEKVFVETSTLPTPPGTGRVVTGSFTVPSGATLGVTGMRVTNAENYSGSTLTPCLSYGYGETEDYLFNVTTPAPQNSVVNLTCFLECYIDQNLSPVVAMRPSCFNNSVCTNATDVDNLTVSLHTAPPALTQVASVNAVLSTDGTATATFPPLSGSYYIKVQSTNHITTWSDGPVAISGTPVSYNFSTAATQAAGVNMVAIPSSSLFAFFGGDFDHDGGVTNDDYTLWEADNNDFNLNMATDANGNGGVDNDDYPCWEINAGNFVAEVTP